MQGVRLTNNQIETDNMTKTTDEKTNPKGARIARQKLRSAKNKEFKANRNLRRRKYMLERRKVEGWEIVGDASTGFTIHRVKDGGTIHIDDEPTKFLKFSDAYQAARGAGQPARMIL